MSSISEVKHALEGMTGIQFETVTGRYCGAELDGIRPLDTGDCPAFSIMFSNTAFMAIAEFVADTFSRAILQDIGIKLSHDPTLWSELTQSAGAAGIKSSITVNGDLTDPSSPAREAWRSLEIECIARIPSPRDGDATVKTLIDVGSTCLGFALAGLDLEEIVSNDLGQVEGARSVALTSRHERNPINRLMCLRAHGYSCAACGMEFKDRYGELGRDYIEVHHLTPISEAGEDVLLNPVTDLIPLCSNCHSMVHRRNPPMPPVELTALLKENRTTNAQDSGPVSLVGETPCLGSELRDQTHQ